MKKPEAGKQMTTKQQEIATGFKFTTTTLLRESYIEETGETKTRSEEGTEGEEQKGEHNQAIKKREDEDGKENMTF